MKLLNLTLTLSLFSSLCSLAALASEKDLQVCDLSAKRSLTPCVLSPSDSHLAIADMFFTNHAAQEKVIASAIGDISLEGGVVTLLEDSDSDLIHPGKTVALYEVLLDDCSSQGSCKTQLWTIIATSVGDEKPTFTNSIAETDSHISINFGRKDPENADAVLIAYLRNHLKPALSF